MMRLFENLFALFFLCGSWETRRKCDLGPTRQEQIDELRLLYRDDADEIILKEYKRLGPCFSRALTREAQTIMTRSGQ